MFSTSWECGLASALLAAQGYSMHRGCISQLHIPKCLCFCLSPKARLCRDISASITAKIKISTTSFFLKVQFQLLTRPGHPLEELTPVPTAQIWFHFTWAVSHATCPFLSTPDIVLSFLSTALFLKITYHGCTHISSIYFITTKSYEKC